MLFKALFSISLIICRVGYTLGSNDHLKNRITWRYSSFQASMPSRSATHTTRDILKVEAILKPGMNGSDVTWEANTCEVLNRHGKVRYSCKN